jgi:hypothetical protein
MSLSWNTNSSRLFNGILFFLMQCAFMNCAKQSVNNVFALPIKHGLVGLTGPGLHHAMLGPPVKSMGCHGMPHLLTHAMPGLKFVSTLIARME